MNLRELLTTVDQLRPNAFTDAEKIRMVNTVEGRIYKDILSKYEGKNLYLYPLQKDRRSGNWWFPFRSRMCMCIISSV